MRRFLTRIRRGGDEGSPALRVWTALTVLVSVFAITAHEDFGALRFSIAGLVALGFLFSWILPRRRDLLFSVLTSVVLMAVASAFTVDMAFGAFFLPYALAACVTLVYNTAEAGMAAAAGGGSAASDPPPAGPPPPPPPRGGAGAARPPRRR